MAVDIIAIGSMVSLFVYVGSLAWKQRRLKGTPPAKVLTSHDSKSLAEWKEVFRETVIAAEGSLSPEMEAFLHGEHFSMLIEERTKVDAIVEERATLLATKLVDERMKQLAGKTKKRRPLKDEHLEEFWADYKASETPYERGSVIENWHQKGFRFLLEERKLLLKFAANETTRDSYRKMFDEQDQEA